MLSKKYQNVYNKLDSNNNLKNLKKTMRAVKYICFSKISLLLLSYNLLNLPCKDCVMMT